ncbi:MAG: glycosyltransferase family 9 protein, partial [Candidatus Cloacimonas sp.]|nr:glycosyltransferase family 9 protein [Candidatus Cloacimonas sp.]
KFNRSWSRTRANYNLFKAFLPLPSWEEAISRKEELNLSTQFMLQEGNLAWANSYLETHELSMKPFVCVHPGSMAKNKYRRWKQEYFVDIIGMLKQNYPYRIIVIAGPDELDVGEYISAKTGALLLTEKSLAHVAALISQCSFFINTDSGIGHIASCFRVLSLTIFGPGDEKQTAPFSPNSHIIRYETDCAPCVGKKKQHCEVECLSKLKPEIVFAKVTELLASLE